jgi:uncharacterized protein YecT (DUF1311 family)
VKLIVAVWLLATPLQAQEFTIDAHRIDRCLAVQDDPMVCVGRAAETCVENRGGGPDMVHAACLQAELDFWDGSLNNAYAHVLDRAREREAADLGYEPGSLITALRQMQRSWIVYRDATCDHALALAAPFGSAAGPAFNECMMVQTARQNFVLRDMRFAYLE